MFYSFGMLRSFFRYELSDQVIASIADSLKNFEGNEELVDQSSEILFSLGELFYYTQNEKVNKFAHKLSSAYSKYSNFS